MKTVLLAALFAFSMLAAPATAHTTVSSNNGKVILIYGNLYEPVSTFQKTGIDFGVTDAKGHPIGGLESATPRLNITLTYGSTPDNGYLYLTGRMTAQFNKTGWYTYPVVYTKPGQYYLHIKGNINGTNVDINIAPKHAINDASDIMFPAKVASADAQEARIAQLEKDVAALKIAATTDTKASPGLSGFALDAALLGLAAVVAARRPRSS